MTYFKVQNDDRFTNLSSDSQGQVCGLVATPQSTQRMCNRQVQWRSTFESLR